MEVGFRNAIICVATTCSQVASSRLFGPRVILNIDTLDSTDDATTAVHGKPQNATATQHLPRRVPRPRELPLASILRVATGVVGFPVALREDCLCPGASSTADDPAKFGLSWPRALTYLRFHCPPWTHWNRW